MGDAIRASDGSKAGEPILESPFPAGAPPIQGEGPQSDYGKNVADMAEKYEKERDETLKAVMAEDPGLAEAQAQADAEQRAATKQAEEKAAKTLEEMDDGAASREPLETKEPEEKPELPEEVKNDPLAEYIEMKDGRPMMRLKVDGEDKLVDIDKVRMNVQKNEAADRRLEYAAEQNKELQRKEAQLRRDQEALNARLSGERAGPPSNEDAGNVDFEERSKEYTNLVFTGDQEEAASYQAETYRLMRQAHAPQEDVKGIIRQEFAAMKQEDADERRKESEKQGYRAFMEAFPEMTEGSTLWIQADSFSNDVVKEHPEWSPTEVMMESGKRTREHIASLREIAVADLPKPPADASRQDAKGKLQHIPRPQTGHKEPEPEERPQTPKEILDETRERRGQPV